MELDRNKLQGIADGIRDGRSEPPGEVIQALASLIGDAEISSSVSVYNFGDSDSDPSQTRATWECIALAGGALVRVSASRTGGDRYSGSFADGDSPVIFGSFVPLREVTECRLIELQSFGDTWVTRWQLHVRNGDPLIVPWPRHRSGKERHEAFAMEVAKRLH